MQGNCQDKDFLWKRTGFIAGQIAVHLAYTLDFCILHDGCEDEMKENELSNIASLLGRQAGHKCHQYKEYQDAY